MCIWFPFLIYRDALIDLLIVLYSFMLLLGWFDNIFYSTHCSIKTLLTRLLFLFPLISYYFRTYILHYLLGIIIMVWKYSFTGFIRPLQATFCITWGYLLGLVWDMCNMTCKPYILARLRTLPDRCFSYHHVPWNQLEDRVQPGPGQKIGCDSRGLCYKSFPIPSNLFLYI